MLNYLTNTGSFKSDIVLSRVHVLKLNFTGVLPDSDHLWYSKNQILGLAFLEQSMHYSSYAKELVNKNYIGSSLEEELTLLRKNIINNTVSVSSVHAGALWFDNMTEYINKLHTIQEQLASHIVKVHVRVRFPVVFLFYVFASSS